MTMKAHIVTAQVLLHYESRLDLRKMGLQLGIQQHSQFLVGSICNLAWVSGQFTVKEKIKCFVEVSKELLNSS